MKTIQPKKLLLIALDWTRSKDPPLSLGQASILANLRQHNVDVLPQSWAVNSPNFSHAEVTKFIMKHADSNTDVATGAYIWNEKATQFILNDLKKNNFPGRIIIGGPQVSYVKNGLEKYYPQADIFIRGYAEKALVQLMQSEKSKSCIKGIHYAGEPDLGLSALAELETLPSPFLTGIIQAQRFIRWESQRGCPFHCSFCQHRESDVTMKRRQFALNRIMEEVQWIGKNKIIQDIAVLDPTFNSGPYYLDIMDKFIEEKYSGKLSLQCRIEMLKDEFLNKVADLNKTGNVVLEFGLQTIHPKEQQLIDRVSNMKLIERKLADVRARNIMFEMSLIFGLPNQTVTSFQQSIEFCKKQQAPKILAFPLMLLRGTLLEEQKSAFELIESHEIASSKIDRVQTDIPHVVTSPSFTYEDWKTMAKMASELEDYNNNVVRAQSTIFSTTWSNIQRAKIYAWGNPLIPNLWQKVRKIAGKTENNYSEQTQSDEQDIRNCRKK